MGLSVTSVHDVLDRPRIIKASHSCVSNCQKCQQLLSTVSKGMYCQHQHQLPSTASNCRKQSAALMNCQPLSETVSNFKQLKENFPNCHELSATVETVINCQKLTTTFKICHYLSEAISQCQQLSASDRN